MFKINKDFIAGAAFGFGAGFVTARSKALESQSFKDLAKSAIRTGLEKFEVARETAMRGAEIFEDLFFEVRSEMKAEAETASEAAFTAEAEAHQQTEFAVPADEATPTKTTRKRAPKEEEAAQPNVM